VPGAVRAVAHVLRPSLPRAEAFILSSRSVWSQIALGISAGATVFVVATHSRPLYLAGEPLGERLVGSVTVDSTELRAPWMKGTAALALSTPQFLADRERFTMDLLRTGRVSVLRARSLADIAVREAYTRRIPPALVLGVMLTENHDLNSSARSSVGAGGLMLVYPKDWTDALHRKFGENVHADSTKLKYGIFILGWVAGRAAALVNHRDDAWRTALLRYNGCVRGTVTPDCQSYPDVVRRQVQQAAKATCRGADFDQCVAQPMWIAHRVVVPTDTSLDGER
jgi:hypothetical protein